MSRIKLEGLPDALVEQLYCVKVNPHRVCVINALKELEGTANIDEILVTIYLQTSTIYQRHNISQILHRMCKDNMLIKQTGNAGIYSLPSEPA